MLDEDWADDRIRFKLIKSLIDTVRRFRAVKNVKVILALREDLLNKVLHIESVPGFQEEKYESLYLILTWNKKQLRELVERRINRLIKRRYTKRDVSFNDVFTSTVDGQDPFEYLLDRTFMRPRDIIMFLNECLQFAEGKPSISAAVIKKAEEIYSAKRLQSLATEWHSIYPSLKPVAQIFYGMKGCFEVSELTRDVILDKYEQITSNIKGREADQITRLFDSLYTENANFGSVRNTVLREIYVTGLIGIKTGPTATTSWSRLTAASTLSPGDVRPSSIVCIHPMFHRALGIRY